MNVRLLVALLVCSLMAGSGSMAAAQVFDNGDDPQRDRGVTVELREDAQARDADKHRGLAFRASQIRGMNVQNRAGDNLGSIDDLVVDMKTGQIRYAALGFGGFLGFGEKMFAVPWGALEMYHDEANDERHFILDVQQATLDETEGFDTDNWPATANKTLFPVEKHRDQQAAPAEQPVR